MKFELRWLVSPRTSIDPPKLQIRYFDIAPGAVPNALGMARAWTEWQDIPVVVGREGTFP